MRKRSIVLFFVVAVMLAGGCGLMGPGRRTAVPRFELVWTNRVDPRARPGMDNKEDGITVECVEFSPDGFSDFVNEVKGLGALELGLTEEKVAAGKAE